MTNAATDKDAANAAGGAQGGKSRPVTKVAALDELVGAHPDALRSIFVSGRPTDPAELGDAPRGRILALGPGVEVFMLMRPILRALATDALPWKGKVFDHGGNSGQNLVFGKQAFRFHAEVGPSALDGSPALLLRYGVAAYKNPWPVRDIVDELRTVAPGIAMGPAFLQTGEQRLLLWFGLEKKQS